MKKILACSLVLLTASALADEGMWTPGQIPALAERLESMGLEIEPGKLTNLTGHPMKAVVSLGGCSASFVSPRGLVVTNHHCAYGSIAHNATDANNLLRDGFRPETLADEVPARPGSRVLVTVEVRDVTNRVLGELPPDLDGRERYLAIEKTGKELVRECEQDPGHRCRVASYHGGANYELIKQLEIRDVRLAYAPPASVGKYGGDVDNWMWPRHTGDFAFYRAYVGPDGAPADYHADNVPYAPDHWLALEPEGIEDGEFVMVAGYPGRTNRYRLADEVRNVIDWSYPERKRVYEEWLDRIESATAGNPDAALKYASLVAGLNNASKNYGGMLQGFAKGDLVERKQALEAELQIWVDADPGRASGYGRAIAELRELVARQQTTQVRDFYYSLARRGALLGAATTLYRLAREREKPDAEREPGFQERDALRIRERMDRIDRSFDAAVDRAVWKHLILTYAAIPADQHVAEFDRLFGIDGNTVDPAALDALLAGLYEGTELDRAEVRREAMEYSVAELETSDDPFMKLAVALYDSDRSLEEQSETLAGLLQEARPRFMEALLAFQRDRGKVIYPDANGTLRITFGTVSGSAPADGLRYLPFTTLEGILEKDTGEEPFDTPPELLQAIRTGDYRGHGDDAIGSVPVNFLSTVDSTGGNSGSPTINGRAELVGLLFDGTYES
ncbi:MAG: S46 family peptidase, partial [Woeseiaceae bacterium]